MGKIIAITGTDCSGKETQTKKLMENLGKIGYKVTYVSFPDYSSPTGKIIAGPCQGKFGESYFDEGFANVDPKIASLYYAADRRYMKDRIEKLVENYDFVIMDRYVESNMAHQGGKITEKEKRLEFYKWEETLEYDLLELPRPDMTIFLYMPYNFAMSLLEKREEKKDSVEMDENYLRNAEATYLELVDLYNFELIDCTLEGEILSIEKISEKVKKVTLSKFKDCKMLEKIKSEEV